MISPLVQKLKLSSTIEDAKQISQEILEAINNKAYPSEEFKLNTIQLATDTLDIYISEFEADFYRKSNDRILDSLMILDTF